MTELATAWMLGCVCGFFMGVTIARPPRDRDPDWRRSFNHENTNRPGGPPPLRLRRSEPDPPELFIRLDEGRIQRGNGKGGPATPKPNIIPKPQFPPPRIIRENFLQ